MISPNLTFQMVVVSSKAGKEWKGRGAAGREDRGEESDDTGVNMWYNSRDYMMGNQDASKCQCKIVWFKEDLVKKKSVVISPL